MKMTLETLWNLRMRPTTKANDLKSLPKMKKTVGSADSNFQVCFCLSVLSCQIKMEGTFG